MVKTTNKMKVDLTLRQRIRYFWWVIFWWTPTLIVIIGYLYSICFTAPIGDIKYLLYFGGWTFTMGFLGLIYLKKKLRRH